MDPPPYPYFHFNHFPPASATHHHPPTLHHAPQYFPSLHHSLPQPYTSAPHPSQPLAPANHHPHFAPPPFHPYPHPSSLPPFPDAATLGLPPASNDSFYDTDYFVGDDLPLSHHLAQVNDQPRTTDTDEPIFYPVASQDEAGNLYFKCPKCEKQYSGKHGRSIWRRHLQDKHQIPLSQQPRRTRWDADANRPKNEEERRARTLESKRRWARKNRATRKQKKGDSEVQPATASSQAETSQETNFNVDQSQEIDSQACASVEPESAPTAPPQSANLPYAQPMPFRSPLRPLSSNIRNSERPSRPQKKAKLNNPLSNFPMKARLPAEQSTSTNSKETQTPTRPGQNTAPGSALSSSVVLGSPYSIRSLPSPAHPSSLLRCVRKPEDEEYDEDREDGTHEESVYQSPTEVVYPRAASTPPDKLLSSPAGPSNELPGVERRLFESPVNPINKANNVFPRASSTPPSRNTKYVESPDAVTISDADPTSHAMFSSPAHPGISKSLGLAAFSSSDASRWFLESPTKDVNYQ